MNLLIISTDSHKSIRDLDRMGKIVSQRRTQIMSPAYSNREINKSFKKSESIIQKRMRFEDFFKIY